MEEGRVELLLQIRTQMQLFHWQTHSYARHQASDAFVKEFDVLVDRLVEASQGHTQCRVQVAVDSIPLKNLQKTQRGEWHNPPFDPLLYLEHVGGLISDWQFSTKGLNTIRDEISSLISKVQFLFSLN